MRLKLTGVAVVCALAALLPAGTALAGKPPHHKRMPPWYLALGDSLARGAQPNAAGATVPTNRGYANDLYASERRKIKGLKLEQLGCLGETTTSMVSGGKCHYAAGSQLAQAIRFIRGHRIALITLDIGANDVDGCASGGAVNLQCVGMGIASIQANVPKIVAALRRAAGRKVRIAAITYYDPFLADYLTGPGGQALAQESVVLAEQVNTALAGDYKAGSFRVGDVAAAFKTYAPFSEMTTLPGHGTVPVAVAEVCRLTWMCAAAPRGPNIHADAAGYRLIAKTIAAAL